MKLKGPWNLLIQFPHLTHGENETLRRLVACSSLRSIISLEFGSEPRALDSWSAALPVPGCFFYYVTSHSPACSASYSVSKEGPNKSCFHLRKQCLCGISEGKESTRLLQAHLSLPSSLASASLLGKAALLLCASITTTTSIDQLWWGWREPWRLARWQSSKCKAANTQKSTSVLLQHFSIRALRNSQLVKRGLWGKALELCLHWQAHCFN